MTGPQQPGGWQPQGPPPQGPTPHAGFGHHDQEPPEPVDHDHHYGPPSPGQRRPLSPDPGWADPVAGPLVASRRPLTGRGRSWLLLAGIGCLVLMYLVIWGGYAHIHQTDRFVQLPPGAPSATTHSNGQYRVLTLERTERIEDPSDPEDPAVAEAGTVFVVAEIEVTSVAAEEESFVCNTSLAVTGVRRIAPASVYAETKIPNSCDSSEVPAGQPYRFLGIYAVPLRFADEIYGVAVDGVDYADPLQVLRPPT